MRIYVPSRGRAGMIMSRQMSTVNFIRTGCTLVVPPDEVERYSRVTRERPDISVLACPVEGIAGVRRWIGEHAKRSREQKFLMIDDDLNFCVRKSDAAYNMRPSTPRDVAEMLAWTEKMLDRHAHASVSPRAQSAGVFKSGTRDEVVQLNKRTLRYLAYRVDDFLAMKHGRVPVMEDFDVNLQLLRSGRTNVLSYWWCQDQRETGSAGGCSSYRTLEAHNAAAQKLAALHAPFVKLREKENRGGVSKAAEALKRRLEVTIYWEKAAADGGYVKEVRA